MIKDLVTLREQMRHIRKDVLAVARYYHNEAYIYIGVNEWDEVKRYQDKVDMLLHVLEALATLEDGEET